MLTAGDCDFDLESGILSVVGGVDVVAGPGASSVGAGTPVREKKLVVIPGLASACGNST
jgi:hypothetical protein